MSALRNRALLPLLPALLLGGCASSSTLCTPVQPPVVPVLPAQARQDGSPTHSVSAQTAIEQWLQLLTAP